MGSVRSLGSPLCSLWVNGVCEVSGLPSVLSVV